MAERTARTIYRVRVVPVPSMLLIAILSAIRTTASAMIFKAAMNVTPTYMPWKRSESEKLELLMIYQTNKQMRIITFHRRRKKKAAPNVDFVGVKKREMIATIMYSKEAT